MVGIGVAIGVDEPARGCVVNTDPDGSEGDACKPSCTLLLGCGSYAEMSTTSSS